MHCDIVIMLYQLEHRSTLWYIAIRSGTWSTYYIYRHVPPMYRNVLLCTTIYYDVPDHVACHLEPCTIIWNCFLGNVAKKFRCRYSHMYTAAAAATTTITTPYMYRHVPLCTTMF